MSRVDIVLAGPLDAAFALAGALDALTERTGAAFRIAGVSGGGALVAGLTGLGHPDEPTVPRVRAMADWLRDQPRAFGPYPFAGSLDFSEDAERWRTGVLAEAFARVAGSGTFADQAEVARQGGPHVVLFALDLSSGNVLRLPDDVGGVPEIGDVPFARAVEAATALPLLSVPIELGGAQLVDAGALGAYPIDAFDRPGKRPRWETLGIRATAALPEPSGLDEPARRRWGVLAALLAVQRSVTVSECDARRTLTLELRPGGGWANAEADVELGAIAAADFLDRFEFEAYVEACRRPPEGAPQPEAEFDDAEIDQLARGAQAYAASHPTPDEPFVGFVGGRPLSLTQLADALARRSPDGERFLRVLEFGADRFGKDALIDALAPRR